MTASKRHAPSTYNTCAENYITMPIALHYPSNMTFHTGKMHTENHCTAQISSLWGVALRPWCGHCPAHSRLGRDRCCFSQAVSVFRMSDTKQQSTTGRENVANHCVRGGRPRRGNIWTMHTFLSDGDVGIILSSAESHESLDATEVRGTRHHFLLHFLRRRLGYSRYAFSWQGCATKVAPSFSPRSREIAVLRL